MADELRTPLNAIIGFSEMMSAEMLGPLGALQYASYARDINQSGAHLLGIIDDILDVPRIELGQFRFLEETVDLVAAIVLPWRFAWSRCACGRSRSASRSRSTTVCRGSGPTGARSSKCWSTCSPTLRSFHGARRRRSDPARAAARPAR